MPTTPKSNRRAQEPEKNRRNRLTEKASSFHGKVPAEATAGRIRRPKTDPDLLASRNFSGASFSEVTPLKLTKLLLNVTVQGSVGAVQVLMSPKCTVGELVAATLRQYTKEGRRPIFATDPSRFDLHYSQFSLESLDREVKLMELGSRNFFLCPKKTAVDGDESFRNGSGKPTTSSSSCSNEVEKPTKGGFGWLKFLDFSK